MMREILRELGTLKNDKEYNYKLKRLYESK